MMKGKYMNMKIKTGAFALVLTMVVNVTPAQYPPASHLATRWWQWVFETPASENPLTDTTGQFAAVNQSGRVWFLAGSIGGTTVRTITVPSGKALFFPIVNVFDVEDAIIAGGVKLFLVPQPVLVAQTVVANIIATATGLSCELDGSPVPITTTANLEQSTPFSLHLPADNILGVPAGVYYPAVDSGYYVLLPPLPGGQHTIHWAGSLTFFSLSLDVTDNITVQ
jgi:hypothetical protein